MNPNPKLPWFKFWAKDWMTDSEVRRLTVAQRGVLFDLLCADWADGGVPRDAAAAKQLCAKGSKLSDVETVLSLFSIEMGEGKVTHAGLAEQRPEAQARRERARRGGIARHASGSTQAEPEPCHAPSRETEGDSEAEEEEEKKSPPLRAREESDFLIPQNEPEAIEMAKGTDAPSHLIAELFHQMNAVGWVDASGRPVRCWSSYVQKSHLKQIRESAAERPKKTVGIRREPPLTTEDHAKGW